jgi:hypothetical protein
MAGLYPSVNDRDWNLLNKICQNTAGIADLEAGDVASITGTANQITVNQPTGAVTLSIPSTFIAPGTIASTTTIKAGSSFIGLNGQTITGNASGAWAIAANGTNQSITLTPSGTGLVNFAGVGNIGATGSDFLAISTGVGNDFILRSQGTTSELRIKGASAQLTSNAAEFQFTGGNTTLNSSSGGLIFKVNGTEKARFAPTTGNLLLGGLTTDGNNGYLQLPTASAVNSGIAFGTTVSLSQIGTGQLALNHIGGTQPIFYFYENGTLKADVRTNGGGMFIETTTAASLTLQTNSTAALTLDSSQFATFAQKVTANHYIPTSTGANGVIWFGTNGGGGARINVPSAAVIDFGINGATATMSVSNTSVAVGGATISATTALIVPASTTAISSMRIPSGTAPTSPVSGDFWYDGTNLKFRDGGTTRTITWT